MYTILAHIAAETEPDINSDAVRNAMNCILENRTLLGTEPVDMKSLKRSPHIYAKLLWSFLNEMEIAQIQNGEAQIVDKCDMG
jgi:hypothetical protein